MNSDGAVVNVEADHELCVGAGMCEMILPAVFQVGDEGVVVVTNENIQEGDAPAVRRAVNDCPTGTLRIVDGH